MMLNISMFNHVSSMKYSLVTQRVKCLPAMWETWVRSLGREDPLEKEMATHSSTLAWKIPWMEEPGGPQLMGSQRVGHDGATLLCFHPFWWSYRFACVLLSFLNFNFFVIGVIIILSSFFFIYPFTFLQCLLINI